MISTGDISESHLPVNTFVDGEPNRGLPLSFDELNS